MTTNTIYWVLVITSAWTHGADGEQVVWSPAPCSNQSSHASLLQLCVPVSKTYTFQVPYDQLGRIDQVDVRNDIVYAMPGQTDASWANEVANSGDEWVPEATTERAKEWAGRIVLMQTQTHLSVTVNMKHKQNISSCSIFRLYWYVAGKDPHCDILVCSVANKKAVNTVGGGAKQSRTVRDTDKMDPSEFVYEATGVKAAGNEWVRQAVGVAAAVNSDCVVCMAAMPQLFLVNALPADESCARTLANATSDRDECAAYQAAFPRLPTDAQPPAFTAPTHTRFTCYDIATCRAGAACTDAGRVPSGLCRRSVELKGSGPLTTQRRDVWWWCGGDVLRGHMEAGVTGRCAYVSLIWPATVITAPQAGGARGRRDAASPPAPDATYTDAIGVPRGVPEEYIADQRGFESLPLISAAFPGAPNQNVENHFQMQRLTSLTPDLGQSSGSPAGLMEWQNRMGVDMLLAESGGVCSMFGDQCCTFIPNSTAADGAGTHTLMLLKTMANTLKEHAGVDDSPKGGFDGLFGSWSIVAVPALATLIAVTACFVFCGCCCALVWRITIERMVKKALSSKFTTTYALKRNDGKEIGNYYTA